MRPTRLGLLILGLIVAASFACSRNGQGSRDTQSESDTDTDTVPASGSLLFAQALGGDEYVDDAELYTYADRTLDVAACPNGGFYVTGGFADTAVFARGTDHEATLETLDRQQGVTWAQMSGDMFLAKYDDDYALSWVLRAGGLSEGLGPGTTYDFGMNLAVQPDGSVVVVGHCESEAALFEGTDGTKITLSCWDNGSTFAAGYGVDGALQFAEILGQISCYPKQNTGDPCFAAAAPQGGFLVLGRTPPGSLTLAPDSTEPLTLSFEQEDDYGLVLSSWDQEGKLRWGELIGPAYVDPLDTAVDDNGGVYMSMYLMTDSVDLSLGVGTDKETTIEPGGSALAKFDKTGAFEWVATTEFDLGLLSPMPDGGVALLTRGAKTIPALGNRLDLPFGQKVVDFSTDGEIKSHAMIEDGEDGYGASAFVALEDGRYALTGLATHTVMMKDERTKAYCAERVQGEGPICYAIWTGVLGKDGKALWRSIDAVSTSSNLYPSSIAHIGSDRIVTVGSIGVPWPEDDLPDNVFGAGEPSETTLTIDGKEDGFVAVYQR